MSITIQVRGTSSGQYFARQIQYSDEETTVERAHHMVNLALPAGREIRITNGSDYLVFHAVDGKILYPENPEAFWEGVREVKAGRALKRPSAGAVKNGESRGSQLET